MQSLRQSSVPPLIRSDGSWALSPEEKSELLSEHFAGKSELLPPQVNEFTEVLNSLGQSMSGFLPIRARKVSSVLRGLREDSGTGPDDIAARVLKFCAASLTIPVAIICRSIVRSGSWPRLWKTHWVFPLFKKKSRSDPANYRGIHLTAQVSKVAERVVGESLKLFLEGTEAYGPNQFAYSSGRGTRDALALCVLRWLVYMDEGVKIGTYCSDVSGAFDRVSAERLLQKLASKGVHPQILAVIRDWLADRIAHVIVDGTSSTARALVNSVYQGTVWGPRLWNCLFEDARRPINDEGYSEVVFADDLNCYKSFDSACSNLAILDDLAECQASLHRWGKANQVRFDAGKESLRTLH